MGVSAADLVLPTFFVIGASKCGTTSLHNYLNAHPEIEMTAHKEPHFMIGPGLEGRLYAYADEFRGRAEIRGDCSPGYAVYPNNPDAAPNIAANVSDARLVYCVRDPVERCLAQYAQHLVTGEESGPIEDAIRPSDEACEYVNASRYATNLEAYLEFFDRERILIVDQSELRYERDRVLSDVFSHVGADPGFRHRSFGVEYNVRGADNVKLPGYLARLREGRLNEASRRLVPAAVRSRVIRRLRRTGHDLRPEPGQAQALELERALGKEARRFRQLTGLELSHWSV